ncbi:MAG: TonB-dependent receptor [Prevotellaceae bacterium]|jgi:TonB-linked SusC/RagA family outer membrane protein|nr:TonB-dependent receptor [Prevotellaceae bacterium]
MKYVRKYATWLMSVLMPVAATVSLSAQEPVVKGNVTDMNGDPLIGVSVVLKGTTQGVLTDADGNYALPVSDNKAVFTFSYIGFQTREEPAGSRKIINVVLQESVAQLGEVVVVGYGTQRKESVVGAITTIQPELLRNGTTRSMSNNLVGQVAGIIGAQRSGEPGYDNSSFWIRGISTFQSSRTPLVLVDGIERSLNNIDPNEIEYFSVLKDAAASAVYGVRGANGVILINTKRGKIGKPTIGVRVETAITQPTRLPEFVDGATYMEVINSILGEAGKANRYSDEAIYNTRYRLDPDLYPDVNWVDAVTKDYASNTRVNLDVNGGSERLRYAFMASYYGESGIMARDKSTEWDPSLKVDRYTMRSNVDINVTPTTLLRFNLGGYLQERNSTPKSIDDIFGDAFVTTPIVHPIQYSTGEFAQVPYRSNPYVMATQSGFRKDNQSKLESLFSLEQDLKGITEGLKFKGVFSFDIYSENSVTREKTPDLYNPATSRHPVTGELQLGAIDVYGQDYLGYAKGAEWGNKSVYFETTLSYARAFAERHAVDAMLMANWRNYDDGDKQPFRTQGYAGRFSYTFDTRYVAEFNFGYNGSENFAKGKRYGFFPSVAVGWIASEEAFMQPLRPVLSKLKFRGSYGLAGNSTLDGRRFAYLSEVTTTDAYEFGYQKEWSIPGRWEGPIGVTDLTWETVYKTNLGVELGLWDMIDVQFDYFIEQRRDIFMRRENFPSSAGFSEAPWANYGKVDNKGLEISLIANKQIGNDFFISLQANMTYAKNEILEIDEPYSVIGTYRSQVGRSVGQLEGLVAERLFEDADFSDVANGILLPGIPTQPSVAKLRPGDIKYKDLNGDGEINSLDITAIGGTEDPRLVYGFGLSANYKNFDLGFLFQGSGNTWRIIGRTENFLPGGGNAATGNIHTNVDDRWTVENPSQDVFYPRLTEGPNANNSAASTWWLRDMSMLRLKNLELGYSLPQALVKKIYLSKARIYLRGTNLFTFSDFKLWDPEVSTRDNNGLRYPIMKSYSIGLEVSF